MRVLDENTFNTSQYSILLTAAKSIDCGGFLLQKSGVSKAFSQGFISIVHGLEYE